MLEVEVKVRLDDRAALRARLQELGAVCAGTESQSDVYFEHPSRDLRARDEALRVRTVDGQSWLTFKGPRQAGATKVRLEHEHRVGGDPAPLLEALGFIRCVEVQKKRESWRWDGLTVAIDDVVGVGRFVEVEVLTDDAAAGSAHVEAALVRLGLGDAPRVAAPYASLV